MVNKKHAVGKLQGLLASIGLWQWIVWGWFSAANQNSIRRDTEVNIQVLWRTFYGLDLFSKYIGNASHLWHHRKKWYLHCLLHDAYSSLNKCHIKLSSYLNNSLIKLNLSFIACSVIKLFICHFFSWKFILINYKSNIYPNSISHDLAFSIYLALGGWIFEKS